MKRDERITLRVSTTEKEQIESWVDEDSDCTGMSEFLRTAARSYATGDDGTSIDREAVVEAVDIGLSPVQEELQGIKNRLASVEAAVEEPDDEITRLAEQIVEELPVHESSDSLPDLARDIPDDIQYGTIRAARMLSSADAWADYYERDISEVREALSLAHSWYPEVQYAEVKESRRWYKTRDLHNHGRD